MRGLFMVNFPETPTGADKNDIKILFDKFRELRDGIAGGDLDSVCEKGSVTDRDITVGGSIFFKVNGGTAEFRFTGGRLELWVNGTRRWSA
jgi:hypothetical protein